MCGHCSLAKSLNQNVPLVFPRGWFQEVTPQQHLVDLPSKSQHLVREYGLGTNKTASFQSVRVMQPNSKPTFLPSSLFDYLSFY